MKLVAWDTSAKTASLVALEWDSSQNSHPTPPRIVAELALNVDATHSDQLLWGIHQVLEAAHWDLKQIDYIGVGLGPGSFTGLRIGVTTARTIAHTLEKPLVGVSSLAAMARPAALKVLDLGLDPNTLVVAVTDACKGELYALWGPAGNVSRCALPLNEEGRGLWQSEVTEQVIDPKELIKRLGHHLSKAKKKSWLVVGPGRYRYLDVWSVLPKARELQDSSLSRDQVQGKYLGYLTWEAIQAGLKQKPLEIHPRYLRASNAELQLKGRLGAAQ